MSRWHSRPVMTMRARYTCTWQCTRCGRENREKGEVRAHCQVHRNGFADNWQDAVELTGELARARARQRLYDLQAQVNDNGWLMGLRVSGLCRGCGRRQKWASAWRHAGACAAGIAALAALFWLIGMPADGMTWLTLLAATGGVAALAEAIGLLVTRGQVTRMTADCRPRIEELHRK